MSKIKDEVFLLTCPTCYCAVYAHNMQDHAGSQHESKTPPCVEDTQPPVFDFGEVKVYANTNQRAVFSSPWMDIPLTYAQWAYLERDERANQMSRLLMMRLKSEVPRGPINQSRILRAFHQLMLETMGDV